MTTNIVETQNSRDLRSFALSLGYSGSLLVDEFPVWLPGRIIRPDLVGFASQPLDMNTATLVAQVIPDGDTAKREIFSVAETLAAPTVTTLGAEALKVWWLGDGAINPPLLTTVSRGDIQRSEFASTPVGRSLAPENLLKAKRGTVQLPLFPLNIGWVQQSRGKTETRLEDLVANSAAAAQERLDQVGHSLADKDLARLVLAAFTLAFIRDRFKFEFDSIEWRRYLTSVHPHLDGWIKDLQPPEGNVLRETISELSSTVNLAALDPALMSNVYERSLVSAQERSELGVVYTPAELASRLLTNLPVEEIPPSERRVLDPTCGSGTLLLAAHDRLKDLVSGRVTDQERHQWLVGHLSGWDRDPFAVEVARLCLTLNALPDGNGWQVEQADALQRRVLDANRPTIIVGNPPWKAQRTSPTGSRMDLAGVFLNWALETLAPEGLLGMLLPAGWLSSDYSAPSRRRVRETCEVLEIWRLPERTFRHGETAPAVLLAKKTTRRRRHYHVERRLIHRESLPRLYAQGVADSATIAQTTASPGEKSDREAPFVARPLTGRVSSVAWPKYLGDIARLRSGPPRHKGAQKGTGDFLMANLRRRPCFSMVDRDACTPVRWPEDFDAKSAGNMADYHSSKLLITGKMRPDNPWSSRVMIDFLGVVPTDAYIMVIPLESELPDGLDVSGAIFALAALCGSVFVSAWIDERRSTRNIPPKLFRCLPLPDGWTTLTTVGRKLVAAAGNSDKLAPIVAEIDSTVATLYRLDDLEFDALKARYANIVAPEGVARFKEPPTSTAISPSNAALLTYGAVLDVTATDMRLWAPGITDDDGDIVLLPPRFPGSLLYTGADFRVRADSNDLRHGEFHPHASAWRSPLLSVTYDFDTAGVEDSNETNGLDDGDDSAGEETEFV